MVDKFLQNKISETPTEIKSADSPAEIQNPRAIIHELKTESPTNGAKPKAVDFVSEDDVKRAVEKGEKIYVTAKTIITPSARDLGEEKEIFAKI
ncbi:MAG: hypothetical protein M3Q33_01010 [Acidobacteriota bacterium]|nr:hypothetical protein [Acidobacteriota bacterium]